MPGNPYRENKGGCMGAYCWASMGDWASMAQKAGLGQYASTPPYELPAHIQDAVAWAIMGPYVQKGQYQQAAEVWNGGVPYSVSNSALGSSGNYAAQVIAKFHNLLHGQQPTTSSSSSSGGGGFDWLKILLDGVLIAAGGVLIYQGGKRTLHQARAQVA